MKSSLPSSRKRLIGVALAAGLLVAFVFAILPRVLPYERLNKFYAILQGEDRHPVDTLPAGSDQEVFLFVENMLNIPETWLLADGHRIAKISKDQIDGRKCVILPASSLSNPGKLQLSIELHYPFFRLSTNHITVFIGKEADF